MGSTPAAGAQQAYTKSLFYAQRLPCILPLQKEPNKSTHINQLWGRSLRFLCYSIYPELSCFADGPEEEEAD